MFTLIASAHAATPVVAEGDAELALTAIEARTGVARENLAALEVSELLAPGPPGAVPCTAAPVTQDALRAELSDVLDLYDAGNLTSAREQAASWTTRVACLTDKVDPDWLWSAGFVTGQLAWEAGDRAAARQAWIQARSVDPTRAWDNDFTPGEEALNTFATAFAGQEIPFRTIGGPFLVDGTPAEPKAPVGLHLFQTESPVRTWLVDVKSPIVAVHPDTQSPHLSLDEWSVLLASRLPSEDLAYLVRGDTVVQLDLRTHTSQLYAAPEPPKQPPKWGRWVAAGGVAVAAVGLVDYLLVSLPNSNQARQDVLNGIVSEETGKAAYDAAVDRSRVDYVLMGTGAAMALVAAPNVVRTWKTEPTAP